MNRISPRMLAVAARLIAVEGQNLRPDELARPPVFYVCEKLRPPLAKLMGKAGFRAVLLRAVAVASADVPWLGTIQVNTDGVMEGWDASALPNAEDMAAGSDAHLVSQLLGLLAAFIGEGLTLRIVRQAWPEVSMEDTDSTPQQL